MHTPRRCWRAVSTLCSHFEVASDREHKAERKTKTRCEAMGNAPECPIVFSALPFALASHKPTLTLPGGTADIDSLRYRRKGNSRAPWDPLSSTARRSAVSLVMPL